MSFEEAAFAAREQFEQDSLASALSNRRPPTPDELTDLFGRFLVHAQAYADPNDAIKAWRQARKVAIGHGTHVPADLYARLKTTWTCHAQRVTH